MNRTFSFFIFVLLLIPGTLIALPLSFQNSPDFSIENINQSVNWFTAEPHPMGSAEQKKVAKTLKQTLKEMGLEVRMQQFDVTAPDLNAAQFGGKQTCKDKVTCLTAKVSGQNIIGTLSGGQKCNVVIAGHYDTKYFHDIRFVGANDGGASTALLLELARMLKKQSPFPKNTLGTCSLSFVFLDGEEAFLPQWDEGMRVLKIQDNLYGSRMFVKKMDKPLQLAIILDMVGHKNQNLFITSGSDLKYTRQFLGAASNIKIIASDITVADDQVPFLSASVPVLHIIDWTNTAEWHTVNDTPAIISAEKTVELGKSFLRFLSLPQEDLNL